MIAEYSFNSDIFILTTRSGEKVILHPDSMRELIETAQIAVAERFQATGKMTV